jgi:lipopolysaccharide transport system ATP-binding protein
MQSAREEFWALKDVGFEINRGEAVGIIGRNGAGKSTLLKILSRITEPTSGRITMDGRVASLLEVGTGFHQELTGRENIFLNGAILGMSKAEIKRKFDEIVAFSEVERFLDTPVKRYSSGMYVRLAFAVAAHLEPEILIVDEVLAVGDAAFQKKCLGKMGQVAKGGRTVLFVSHNTVAIKALCTKGLYLKDGKRVCFGNIEDAVKEYQSGPAEYQVNGGDLRNHPRGNISVLTNKLQFESVALRFFDARGETTSCLFSGGSLEIRTTLKSGKAVSQANVAAIIYDSTPYRLIDVNLALRGQSIHLEEGKSGEVVFRLKDVQLKPGSYSLSLWTGRGGIEEFDAVEQAALFEVRPDLSKVKHTEVFPGPYQCDFEASMVNGNGSL